MVQKPSVRPGRSPRARPTGAPQSARLQNRFRSGTSGSASTAVRGSGRGTSGTLTRPAPSAFRPEAAEAEERELRTETEREVDRPDRERDSRPDTERRDEEERAERADRDRPEAPDEGSRPGTEPRPDAERWPGSEPRPDAERWPGSEPRPEAATRPDDAEPPPGPPWPVIPVAGEPTIPCGETTGAIPQTSQYSSPPPTSS
ncbi:hypothetical protein TPA0910_27090 [Streptomyces hygroscopicus subsp. sporocinereus]|uniref:Uncharacterized protein n=1 Tax=Streptomyces hygroscopicus TaxID=1912 RepID=A0ABQ3TYV4_STRHY|nr:hypothetical protein TPA0910_27090 [Streptomyces hygroscopicus]